MSDFKQRFKVIYEKYTALYGVGCARVNETSFAKFLDIPVTSVRNWRDRNTVPSAKGLKAIHDKLGFAYDWLISGDGEMFDTKDAEIARLQSMLFHDGVTDKESLPDTAKAAGQE